MATVNDENKIEKVREIVDTYDLATLRSRIAAASTEAWTATVADFTEWDKVKNKVSKLDGGSLGIKKDPAEARLLIRNRVRIRFGYLKVDQNGRELGDGQSAVKSKNVPITGY